MNTPHTLHPVTSSLELLWSWLMAKPGHLPAVQKAGQPRSRAAASCCSQIVHNPLAGIPTECHQTVGPALRRPVRVLQVMEAGQSPAQAGRLRISGRMADVCAELDRLAASEALLH